MDLKDLQVPIYLWMAQGLKLKKNELLVYAIIYHYTLQEEGGLKISLSELAKILKITKKGMFNLIKRLVAKGIIEKETKKRPCKYSANLDIAESVKKSWEQEVQYGI
jgi:DNA-binding MarR family transcriptional regulator